LTISISPLAIIWLFRNEYKTRVKGSKALNEFSNLIIPVEIMNLVNRFHPSAEIRIANDAYAIPQAAFWVKYPDYVIVSKLTLGQTNDKIPQFENKHLLALIAHELGHIELERHSSWIEITLMSGFVISLCFFLFSLVQFNLTGFLCSLVSTITFWFFINILSQINEYRADAFAVKCALIPLNDLSLALTTIQNFYDNRNIASKEPLQRIMRNSRNIFINTHPSINRRIQRLQKYSNEPR
jgi:hypothetical protein